jgi:hypothetical protein
MTSIDDCTTPVRLRSQRISKRIRGLRGALPGLWSAVGATRDRDELGVGPDIMVTLVNRDALHGTRVRSD